MRIRSLVGVTLLALPVWLAAIPGVPPVSPATAQAAGPAAAALPAEAPAASTGFQWPGAVTAPRADADKLGGMSVLLYKEGRNGLDVRLALIPGAVLVAMAVLGIVTFRMARKDGR
jgi:hypothetical protein